MTHERGSPTVRRRRLGLQLRAYRERSNLTLEQAANRIDTNERSLRRWELGQYTIRSRDLRNLLDLYEVDGDARTEMENLAREARLSGWWTPYTSSVRPTFATFLGLEAEATSLSEFAAMVVPGLLQTPRYIDAVLTAAIPRIDDDTVAKRTEVRLKRQAEIMARAVPMHFVIDESVLHRCVGDRDIMGEQLERIAEVARSRFVTVQVIPFEVGIHDAVLGSFSVLTFDGMPPVACVEMLGGDLFADGEDSLLYNEHFDKLREGALPQPLSVSLVAKIRKDVHGY